MEGRCSRPATKCGIVFGKRSERRGKGEREACGLRIGDY